MYRAVKDRRSERLFVYLKTAHLPFTEISVKVQNNLFNKIVKKSNGGLVEGSKDRRYSVHGTPTLISSPPVIGVARGEF